jgi:hypothetical protein
MLSEAARGWDGVDDWEGGRKRDQEIRSLKVGVAVLGGSRRRRGCRAAPNLLIS